VRVVNLETGEEWDEAYDRLILAPGARAIIPEVPGVHAPNVYTLRNLEDADRVKAMLDTAWVKRAVVVGAGFIGLEMAEQLHGLGVHVAVVDLAPQVLAPLDAEMARAVHARLTEEWIDVRLGSGLREIRLHEEMATGVVLEDGTTLDADLVILAIGVVPNTELAVHAGLEIGGMGGNEYMQTNDQHIYAVGDVCEYPETYLGMPMRIPLAGPANRAGRIAGEHAATGAVRPMGLVLGTAIVRVLGKSVALTGLTEK
jgi:NADPH-dependent 2,4-dienoyl-CoA reductase/sulfur reductase-like enzyme